LNFISISILIPSSARLHGLQESDDEDESPFGGDAEDFGGPAGDASALASLRFRWVNNAPGRSEHGQTPCGTCPVVRECSTRGGGDIGAVGCEYIKWWTHGATGQLDLGWRKHLVE
jgi:hypothetical protein